MKVTWHTPSNTPVVCALHFFIRILARPQGDHLSPLDLRQTHWKIKGVRPGWAEGPSLSHGIWSWEGPSKAPISSQLGCIANYQSMARVCLLPYTIYGYITLKWHYLTLSKPCQTSSVLTSHETNKLCLDHNLTFTKHTSKIKFYESLCRPCRRCL